ncbi:MAG: alkaline phosphatase family protein [Fimbriimonadaceae bacterium]
MVRIFFAALAAVLAASGPAQTTGKVILVSWDGAADWVVDKLLAQGRLPNLARLNRSEYLLASFPSKTAVGHASIFNGSWPNSHGITGNSVPRLPRSENSFVESQSGFSSGALRTEPIYVTAAKQGKKVVVLSATQSYPPDPHIKSLGTSKSNFVSFSGFENEIAPAAMHTFASKDVPAEAWTDLPPGNGPYREIRFQIADTAIFALAYNDPKDPANGYDTLLIRPKSRSLGVARAQTIIKPKPGTSLDDRAWSKPIKITKGELYGYTSFRLFNLDLELEKVQLYQSKVSMIRGAASAEDTAKYSETYRGFHDDPFGNYEDGMLGKTIWQGGGGEAEARVVEIVRRDVENLKRGTRHALAKWKPDLLTHYQPMTDSAGHSWIGVLDPSSPSYRKELADALWPYYARIYELQDEWLGDIMAAAPNYNILIVSDHGMEGTTRTFYPNALLEKAGLLKRTFGNAVEPAQTRIAAPPYGDFFLTVNGLEWKQGLVPASERAALLDEVRMLLMGARDPDTGDQIVRRVYKADEHPEFGIGGPAGGDLYLDLAPGYTSSSRISDRIVGRSNSPIGDGSHGFIPSRRSMQAIFYWGAPDSGAGPRSLGVLRQIDVAPTIARILGITPPSTYSGTAVPPPP